MTERDRIRLDREYLRTRISACEIHRSESDVRADVKNRPRILDRKRVVAVNEYLAERREMLVRPERKPRIAPERGYSHSERPRRETKHLSDRKPPREDGQTKSIQKCRCEPNHFRRQQQSTRYLRCIPLGHFVTIVRYPTGYASGPQTSLYRGTQAHRSLSNAAAPVITSGRSILGSGPNTKDAPATPAKRIPIKTNQEKSNEQEGFLLSRINVWWIY